MKKILDQKRRSYPLLKLSLKMKISMLSMFLVLFTMQANSSYAQRTKITLDLNNVTIERLIDEIESQTDFHFVYQIKEVDLSRLVSVKANKELVTSILERIFGNTRTTHNVVDKQIFLKEREPQSNNFSPKVPSSPIELQMVVSGIVTDNDGTPLPGANVVEKGTTNGVTADFDGNFNIDLEENNAVLVVSYIGFATKEVVVNEKSNITVVLEEDAAGLDEVVVVGYGTQNRIDLTGAVASVNLDDFREAPNVNVFQSLQGTIPGIQIGQVNQTGESPSISVRGQTTINGNSDVLVVLDGIIYRGNLSDINPNDIQSIDVLKDASSKAIYGAQAANGVLLITSKKGKTGQQGNRINYSTYMSIQFPTVNASLLNREEWIQKVKDSQYQDAYLGPDYLEENPAFDFNMTSLRGTNLDGISNGSNFDWFDEATQTGLIQNHNFSISGANEAVSYFVSANHLKQDGIIKNDTYKRNSVRINLETNVASWLKFGINSFAAFGNRSGIHPNLSSIMQISPVVGWKDSDGDYILSPLEDGTANPFFNSLADNEDLNQNISGNFYFDADIPFIKGLNYRINYNNSSRTTSNFYSNIYDNGFSGAAFKNNTASKEMLLDNILTYDKAFDDHHVKLTLVSGINTREYNSTEARGQGYSDLSLSYNSLQQGDIQTINSGAWDESYVYQMARLNYKFKTQYLLTATLRRDGFSGFAPGNKTGLFPSIGLGWIVSEEPFMNKTSNNYLKLRASYGQNGNLTNRYSSLATVSTNASSYYVFGDGVSTSIGHNPSTLANENLTWERTKELNFGLDFNVFNNRLDGSINYYNTNTNDLLWDLNVPTLTGFSSVKTNIGEINNKGIELTANYQILNGSDFTWDIGVNFSSNKNKVVTLLGQDVDGDGVEDDLIASGLFIGKSIGTIYDYEVEGIWQIDDDIMPGFEPGSYKIVDQNGDGSISASDDRVFLGRTEPLYRFGIQNTFQYKDFSLRFFINSVQGGENGYMSANNPYYASIGDIQNRNWFNSYELWSPQNPDVKYEAGYTSPAVRASRYFSRNFVRFQDISLAYNVPTSVLDQLKIDRLKLYVSGKNLLTLTDWDGWDPESAQGIYTGDNFPVLKSITFGLDISF